MGSFIPQWAEWHNRGDKDSKQLEIVATNSVEEGVDVTPALVDEP